MVQPVLAAVTTFTAVFALAACGGGPQALTPDVRPSIDPQTTVSEPAVQPDKLTGPAPGDVSCMIDADWARCDIIDRDWSPPARTADCELDYGHGISLASSEGAHFV